MRKIKRKKMKKGITVAAAGDKEEKTLCTHPVWDSTASLGSDTSDSNPSYMYGYRREANNLFPTEKEMDPETQTLLVKC